MPDHTTITGTPLAEIYRRDEFAIVKLHGKTRDKQRVISGNIPQSDLKFGLRYVFSGVWKNHQQHGPTFHVDGYALKQPTSRAGLLKYLETFDGIGVKRAQKIVDHFGVERCLAELRRERDYPSGGEAYSYLIGLGVSHGAIEKLCEDVTVHNTDTRIELLGLLSGRGFPSSLITEVVREFGMSAPTRIRSDPFVLLKFSGSGFIRCDTLWRDLGLPLDSPVRARHCVSYAIRQNRHGDSWISGHALLQSISGMLGVDTGTTAEDAVRKCIDEGIISYVCVDGRYWVADAAEHSAEVVIGEKLGELAGELAGGVG